MSKLTPRTKYKLLMDFTTLVGLVAAFCTTVSYYPQLKKCWTTGSACVFRRLRTGIPIEAGQWFERLRTAVR